MVEVIVKTDDNVYFEAQWFVVACEILLLGFVTELEVPSRLVLAEKLLELVMLLGNMKLRTARAFENSGIRIFSGLRNG